MQDGTVTKLQVKLTKAALERLIGEDVELETIIGHQLVQTIVDQHAERLVHRITSHVTAGLDLQGLSVANSVFNDKIRELIKTLVGNHVRCHETELQGLIRLEVERQLPDHIRNAVSTAMKRMSERVLAEFNGA